MRRTILANLGIVPFSQPQNTMPKPDDLRTAVDTLVRSYADGKHGVVIGVGLVCQAKRHAWFYGDVESVCPNSIVDNMLFEIGSITKPFTTILLADMHLNGVVQLDDPVNEFLPVSACLPSRGGIEVSLKHLATHTSGLACLPNNLDWKHRLLSDNPYAEYSVDDLYSYLSTCRLKSTPGRVYRYSNLGFGLLGHVLGLAAGTDYEALVTDRVCNPLQMQDTLITPRAGQKNRLAIGHSGGQKVSNWEMPTLAGAGAIRSSLNDMLIFLAAQVAPTKTRLREPIEFAQTMQTERKRALYRDYRFMAPLALLGTTGLFIWQSFGLPIWKRLAISLAVPLVMKCVWPRGLTDLALGWHADLRRHGRNNEQVLWHNGRTGGYASFIGFSRAAEVGVVLLSNCDKPRDRLGRRLLDLLLLFARRTPEEQDLN